MASFQLGHLNAFSSAPVLSISVAMCTQTDHSRLCRCCRYGSNNFTLQWTVKTITLVITILLTFMHGLSEAKKTVDYCSADLCPVGTRHVVCEGYRFGGNCSRPMLVKMTPKYVNLILNYHNGKRNRLACGAMRRFASASSMQKLVSER